jgi:dihydrolipoamide dehydrogenase
LTVDKLIVAVGRKPNTENLFAGDVQVTLTDRGFIDVDSEGRTSMENVWAAGDVTPGPMLAHKGSEEGVAVAERIVTGIGHVNYNTIPWVIYTAPEIAWAGLSEQQAIEAGHDVATGSFPYAASGRAKAMQETSGMVKFVTDAHTDRILGVHMIGAHASELIAEVVVAMEFGASSEDIARTVHAHPTLSEIVHEAALSVDKRALHKVN